MALNLVIVERLRTVYNIRDLKSELASNGKKSDNRVNGSFIKRFVYSGVFGDTP
jgi:hypothetical protein